MKYFVSFLTKRSTKYGSNLFALVVIVLGVLILANYLSYKHYKRWDATKNKKHSLSDQSIKTLRNLTDKISLKAFYKKGDQAEKQFKDLINEYTYYSNKLKCEFIDPDRNPAITQNYGVSAYGTTILEYGGRTEKITQGAEEALTNALLKITSGEVKKVYFLEGHGEADIDSTEKDGYDTVKKNLRNQTLETAKLLLMREKEVPEDCTVLVIAGPKKDLFDHEKEAITRYLKSGGAAFFLVNPEPYASLSEFLNDWGVKTGQDMIVDPLSRMVGGDNFMPLVSTYQKHIITENFNIASFFPLARSISRANNIKTGISVTELAKTSPGSWGETNLKNTTMEFNEGEDIKGPVCLAVAVTAQAEENKQELSKETPDSRIATAGPVAEPAAAVSDTSKKTASRRSNREQTRIVVAGDSDFANNQFIGLSGNSDFFLNIISWLAGEEKLISIRPKDPEFDRINLSAKQAHYIFWLSIIFYPVVLLASAGVVWWRRRK